MSNYSFFIGIDISKSVIDVSYTSDGTAIYLGQYNNTIKGYKSLSKKLSRQTIITQENWFFCFENTGIYSKPLLKWLIPQGLQCREENAMKISRSLGLRRGKNDEIDSRDICEYAYEKRNKLKATDLPSPLISKLKKLLYRRDFLVSKRQSLAVSIKEQEGFIEKDIYNELKMGNDKILKVITEQIKNLEKSIQSLLKSNDQISKNNSLARSVVGIGPITSAYMIAITRNFSCFSNSRKFCCYSGVAPFPNSSGMRKGNSRVSHIANKKMKSLFSNCIMAAIKHDPEIANYYRRKLKEGKRPGVIMNAIKNKLIHRTFAVVKRGTPYVKLMSYA